MAIEVIRPGLLTSIQDLGRRGWQRFGIPVGGAMDPIALRVGNLLVGNEPGAASLEMTLMGPTLRFADDTLIAICGADLSPQLDHVKIPGWRPIWVRGGSELRFGSAVTGCRAYLAVAGGFDVPEVLESCSTYFQAGMGGFEGRAIRPGDLLKTRTRGARGWLAMPLHASRVPRRSLGTSCTTTWHVTPALAGYTEKPTIRFCPGRHRERFSESVLADFCSSEFEVTSQSDRVGYRLSGPPLASNLSAELLSEAVTTGTIQVPPNGQPIVLMADCPVTGGYPKIAQVAGVDQPVLAQLRPGAKVQFREIKIEEALALYRDREIELTKLQCALELKTIEFW
jgi:antagonist of KipI